MAGIQADLPDDMEDPVIQKFDPNGTADYFAGNCRQPIDA